MPLWMIPAAGAGLGAISDIISQGSQRSALEDFLENARKSLSSLLVSKQEEDRRISESDREFMTSIGDVANRYAFRGRNILEKGKFVASGVAPLYAEKAKTATGIRAGVDAFNTQIKTKLAELESTPVPGYDPSQTFATALAGGQAGLGLQKYLSWKDDFKWMLDEIRGRE
jgi:hypothetical protein